MYHEAERMESFKSAVLQEAQTEINQLLDEAESKKKQLLEEANDKFLNEAYCRIQSDIKKINSDYIKEVSRESFAVKKEAIAERTKLVDSLFDKIERRVAEFVSSDKYSSYLKEALEKANKAYPFNDKTVIRVREKDLSDTSVASVQNVSKEADKSIRMGGVIVFYSDSSLLVDLTLDAAFKREKELFATKSELQF